MTLDAVADESRKTTADNVTSPWLGFVAETGNIVTIDALSTIFLLFWIPTIYFVFP